MLIIQILKSYCIKLNKASFEYVIYANRMQMANKKDLQINVSL